MKVKSILESCTVHTAIITIPFSLSVPAEGPIFFPFLCCRITPDSSLKANRNCCYIALNRLGSTEGLVLLYCSISILRSGERLGFWRVLTELLGEEKTVALLEGDTLPVSILLDCHSVSLSHANVDWA